ncbi:DUF1146 family protein [Paenibacillus farraposensis]|uniref:DUF1146 family protein n=1 Tax=Paenibacillus farraposensis TaxID=2807095 RepID=A0ABW4DHQ7_9BACL|nr:DUF1146 family protein [Paenibacillus farraposensis]MCC3379442.1 DUF1146 domain-containing protein [Paenibacillus farraposensis]
MNGKQQLAEQLSQSASMTALTSMIVSLICIALAWWALQSLKLDVFIKHPKGPQGRLLHLFLAIIVGQLVSGFLLNYFSWSQML